MYIVFFLYYILIFNYFFLFSNKIIVLIINRRMKNDIIFIILVGYINVDLLFNIFFMVWYIVLFVLNGVMILNIFLLMVIKMIELI